MEREISDTILQAVILTAGAFIGAVLGNVFRPVLEHYLHGKAQRREQATASAREQFDKLYRPLYDLFQNSTAPDEPYGEMSPQTRDEMLKLFRENRHLAEPGLEYSMAAVEETAWTFRGEVHGGEIEEVYRQVSRRYNSLRGQLSLPHRTWRHRFSPRNWYRQLRWRYWKFRSWWSLRQAVRRRKKERSS